MTETVSVLHSPKPQTVPWASLCVSSTLGSPSRLHFSSPSDVVDFKTESQAAKCQELEDACRHQSYPTASSFPFMVWDLGLVLGIFLGFFYRGRITIRRV